MKDAIPFVSKVLKKEDTDFNSIHFCEHSIQCSDGHTTTSYPHKGTSKPFSVNGAALSKALEICEWEPDVKLEKKQLVIKDKNSAFQARLAISTDYSENHPKIEPKKVIPIPANFVDMLLKTMLPFTAKNSDYRWAESIMIIGKYAYCTNNISVIRTKLESKLPSCIIPRPLLNVMLKLKVPAYGMYITERLTLILYDSGAWIACPSITENPPDISAVYGQFKKPVPISESDLKALKNAISMSVDGELKIKDGTVSVDTCSVEGTELKDCKLASDNLEIILSHFDRAKFGKELSCFSNDTFECILAGRA